MRDTRTIHVTPHALPHTHLVWYNTSKQCCVFSLRFFFEPLAKIARRSLVFLPRSVAVPSWPNRMPVTSNVAAASKIVRPRAPTAASIPASDSHLDLSRAPYVLYGVRYIDPVPLAPFSDHAQDVPGRVGLDYVRRLCPRYFTV